MFLRAPRLVAVIAAISGLWMADAAGFSPVQSAYAQDAEASKSYVKEVADRMVALIKAPTTEQQKRVEFKEMMNDTAAMGLIAKYVAGRPWKEMSDAQRDTYRKAFEDYLARTYVSRFNDYQGETLDVVRATDQGKKGIFVMTQVARPGAEPIDVEWRVSDRTGELKVIDIYVEGVSMLITQRDEFASMIDQKRGDIDAFIAELKARAAS